MTALLLNGKYPLAEVYQWIAGAEEEFVVACGPSVDVTEASRNRSMRVVPVPEYDRGDWIVPLCVERVVDRIIAISERDILRAAAARELLGLPGQPISSALAYRDKYVMKSVAATAGVPVPPMAAVRTLADVAEFANVHGWPVVVKPRASAACQGIVTLDNETDLCRLPRTLDHIVEAWLNMPTFHVDGLMRDGDVLHSSPSRYAMPNLESIERLRPCVSAMLDPVSDARVLALRTQTARVVRALPATSAAMAFHAEFFLDDSEPVLCEIASRPANPTLADVQWRAYGYSLHREAILGQAVDSTFVPPSGGPTGLFGWAFFPRRNGVLAALPQDALPGEVWLDLRAELGRTYTKATAPLDHVAKAVFRVNPSRTEAGAEAVVRWWEEGARWLDGTDEEWN
ncbi:ATP-grasp domain-containing protein [Pseudonocardia phyllosphaerae]|uniref:ATP-grasp domain-containing protein n=1 Tax=Pseudonocardia phyllosphaerae TaxID=3390502 RepID=UPI00397998C3